MKFSILILCLVFFSLTALGQVQLADDSTTLEITQNIKTSLQSPTNNDYLNFEFKSQEQPEIRLDYSSQALWIKIRIQNLTSNSFEKMIYFSSALTGVVELFDNENKGHILKSGSSVPYINRPYPSKLTSFSVHLEPRSDKTIYLKRTSHHTLATKIYLSDVMSMKESENDSKVLLFFYLGSVLSLVIYNLLVGLYSKDINYLYYSLFASSYALVVFVILGGIDSYVFSKSQISFSHYLMVFSSLATQMTLVFAYKFLNINQNLLKAKKTFYALFALATIHLIVGMFPDYIELQIFFGRTVDIVIMTTLFFMIYCGISVLKGGYKLAQFFLFSFASVFIGVVLWFGTIYGLFPNNWYTYNSLLLGNLGEMLILALGLAYKINILDFEKQKALLEAKDKKRYHRLVKILSHDVANSITMLSGSVFRLKKSIINRDKSSFDLRSLERINSIINNLKEMLSSVRDEEVFNVFKNSAHLQKIDLNSVIQEVVSLYEDRIQEKEIILSIETAERALVMADRTVLVNQILSNILSNAIKFSRPQSQLKVSTIEFQESVLLIVQDSGVGMLEQDIQKIFFSDALLSRSGTSREAGSGLGLSLVKEYMNIFSGKIKVTSFHESMSSNSGTSITLVFPKIEIAD